MKVLLDIGIKVTPNERQDSAPWQQGPTDGDVSTPYSPDKHHGQTEHFNSHRLPNDATLGPPNILVVPCQNTKIGTENPSIDNMCRKLHNYNEAEQSRHLPGTR